MYESLKTSRFNGSEACHESLERLLDLLQFSLCSFVETFVLLQLLLRFLMINRALLNRSLHVRDDFSIRLLEVESATFVDTQRIQPARSFAPCAP